MKQLVTPLLVLSFIAFILSCDDSFLEENKKVIDGYMLDTSLYVNPTNEFTEVSVTLPDQKNKDFKVVQYPTLIQFESLKGHIDEQGNLKFKIKVGDFETNVSLDPLELGHILLNISDFGMLSIPILHLNTGVSKANINNTSFDFGVQSAEEYFKMENLENGFLWYRMVEKPSWVTLRHTSLLDEYLELDKEMVMGPYDWAYYSIFPDRTMLTPGEHEGEIVIETSDPSNPVFIIEIRITIRSYENPESMIPVEGTIVDARFNKTTNTLFYITHNPVKLVSFNLDTGIKNEKITERSPTSIRLSADNKTILIGESGMMEFVEATTLSTRDKVELPYTVSEIEDGENGYYYLTNNEKEVFSYNTLTREIKKQEILTSGGHSIIEANMLVKAAGKSQLLLSRKNISPNGLYLVDFSDPENLSFIKYWHSGFGNRFFTSTDRDFIYSINNGHLYQFPNSDTANNLYDLGKFVPDQTNYDNFYGYNWFDHNMASSSVWASYNFRSIEKNAVIEFNDKTLERKRVVELNDYVTIIKGKKDYYKTLAHYIFSNSENDRLIVIKNVDEYNANAWHLEIVDISH